MTEELVLHPSDDPATQSNYDDIATTHLHLDWTVDFSQSFIRGSVVHSLLAKKNGINQVVFDSSFISIKRIVEVKDEKEIGELKWHLPKRNKSMGSALKVELGRELKKGDNVEVKIEYSTTDECTALGWLTPEQTDSGKYAFLYSQCQAIHCRSLIPCQDTPSVKATYSAVVHSPLPILLSARRTSPPPSAPQPEIDGQLHTYKFEQSIAIPSYLIAIAGGELAFKALGERTGIWAEPGMLERSAWEFQEDAEKIVSGLEELVTPYVWGRYDALVLPASFPYGGMENANLTPALIVGDRSQVDVLGHEASHSWHGNLISCSDWASFWLNEGWTTYTERLLTGKLHGNPASRDFEYIIGEKAMKDDLKRFDKDGLRFGQRLHIPYEKGVDPDDVYSSVAYDKGANFLYCLEKTVGGLEVFNPYHKAFVKKFSGHSISTQDWLDHFWSYWSQFPEKEKLLKEKVDFDAWLNGEGLDLPVKMEYDTSLADASYALAASWDSARSLPREELVKKFSKADIEKFQTNQVIVFLETLAGKDSFEKNQEAIEVMEEVYGFLETKNPEIKLRNFLVSLKAGLYATEAAAFVRTVGRLKYVRPIYRAIFEIEPELAKKTFLESKHLLHPIARTMVARDLGLEK
ncbi:bifunctional aminopeptidase/epoxide hydrolase [Sporobolomyces salmoneus]|uniref:bifunctional aminopeptidase/epoxide hydrolase n=1 Tax=Sporobolomyces salmoneus TaxID=183962 RepID=UPI00317D467A